MSAAYRSLWLSDVHLGTRASRAEDLLRFLDHVDADQVYLVGDIVDLERMKIKPSFIDVHRRVLSRFIELAAQGVAVRYIPGNHDFELRDFIGHELFGVPVLLEAEHITPAGERLLITHGDVLDGRIRKGTNLEKFGAAAYHFLMDVDVLVNRMRQALGRDYFPISAYLKSKLSRANQYIERFEVVAAQYASERGFDGIVCGHIHRPALRRIDGCLYANDGDWVEHGTALAERHDGALEIIEYRSSRLVVHATYMPTPPAAAA